MAYENIQLVRRLSQEYTEIVDHMCSVRGERLKGLYRKSLAISDALNNALERRFEELQNLFDPDGLVEIKEIMAALDTTIDRLNTHLLREMNLTRN